MIELFDVVRDLLALAVTVLVPLVLAGLAGAVVGGLAVMWLGLQDQAISAMIRGIAVVLALVFTGVAAFDGAVEHTTAAWSHVAALGQRGVAIER